MPSGSKRRKAAKKPKPEGPPLSPNDPLEAELVPEFVPEEEGMGQDEEEFTDEVSPSPKAAEDDAEAMIIKGEHEECVERAMSEDLGNIQTEGDHGVHEDNGKAHPPSLAESESETPMDTQPEAHTQSLDKAEPDMLMETQTEAPTGTEPDEEALTLVRDGASAPEVELEIDEEANVNTFEIEADNESTSDNAIQPEIAIALTEVVPEASEGAADIEPDSTTGPDEAETGAVPATDQETSTGPSDEAVGLNTASDAQIDAVLVDPELDTGTKLATATALFDDEHGIGLAPIETTPGLETELAEDKHVEDETIESEDKVLLEAARGDLPEVISRETQVEPPEETESVVPTEKELPGDTEPGAEIVSPDEADASEAPLQAETEGFPGVISREAVVEVEPPAETEPPEEAKAERVVPLVEETPPDVVFGEADAEVGPSTEIELPEHIEAAAEIAHEVRAETLDEARPSEDEGVEPPTEIGSPGEMEPAEDIVSKVRAETPGEAGSDSIEAESVLVPLEQAEPGAEPDVEPLREISAPPDVGTAVEVAMDATEAESVSALLERAEPGAEPDVESLQESGADVGTAVEVAMDSTETESVSALLEQAEPGAEPDVEPLQERGAPPDVGTAVEVAMDSTETETVSAPLEQAEPGAEPDVEPLQESGAPPDVGTAVEVMIEPEAEVETPIEGGSDHKDLTEEDSSGVDKDSSIKLDADGEAVEELEPAPEAEPLQELHSAPDVEITGVKVETPMDAELKFRVEASPEDQCDLVEVEPKREVEGLAQTEGHEGSLAEIEEQIETSQPNLCGETGGNSELNERLDMVSASKEAAFLGAVPATETTNDADDEPVHEKEVIKSTDEAEKSATPEQGEGIRLVGGVPNEQVSGIDVEGMIEPAVTEPGSEFEGRVDQERAVGDEMLLGKDQELVLCEQGVGADTSVAYEEGAEGGHGEEQRIIVLPQATDEFELESEAHTQAEDVDTKAAAFDPKVHLKSLLCEQEKDIGEEEAVSSVMAEAGSVLEEEVSENFHPEFVSDDQEMGLSEPRESDDALSIDEAEEQFGMDSKHRLDSEPTVIDEDNHGSGKEEPDDADGTSDLTEAPQAESSGVANLDQVPFCHQEEGQPDIGNEEMDLCKRMGSDNGEIDHTEDRNLDVPVSCALTPVPTTMSMSTATEADGLDTSNPNGDSHINEMREVEAYLLEVDYSNGHKEATNRAEETVPHVEEVLRSLPEHDVEEGSMPMVVPAIKKRALENEKSKSTEPASGGATLERRTKWLGCCGMFDAILGKG